MPYADRAPLSQSILFLNEYTLRGKRDVYILVKILKWLTASTSKSFQCKYAAHSALLNKWRTKGISDNELGGAVQDVIHHHTIRGKFDSVHPDLQAEGVTKVEVGDHGLTFHRDLLQGKFNPQCKLT